ncbi:MAG: DNA topoisomerase IB [Bacillota bacterium]
MQKKIKNINEIENLINEKLDNLIVTMPEEIAEVVGLEYVCDSDEGCTRRRHGKGFIYLSSKGERVTDKKLLSRFESLIIPPAWTNVWICNSSNGHIQATGRDQKGRKQYIYHTRWEEISNSNKFNLMIKFGESLPLIRARVEEDLKKHNLSREKVLAILVSLLEQTMIRIGNPEYAKQNGSYGLTTLRNKHTNVTGSKIKFMFKGKSGKQWEVDVENRRLARLVKQCQELPGQKLFQYVDEQGNLQSVGSADVNNYLKEIIGMDFTAKDFRTWGGTVLAAKEFNRLGPAESETDSKKKIIQTVKTVSHALNNTPSVCRKYYIHPEVITSFTEGTLFEEIKNASENRDNTQPFGLDAEELAVLNILRNGLLEKEVLLNSA